GYGAATEVAHEIDGWRCRPDVAIQPEDCDPIPREAPLLAVEIRSESNPRRELRAKAARYLEHGTAMVWLVYPETRSLEICRPGEELQTLSGADLLEGGATLPGFRASVSELFPPALEE
ncbi:MAG: Uma2 family endonuclease, partial [Anaerolineaceae bacterium]|nr:Uma2 family endonuclease [Anaerolineaceae bacterium]